MEVAFDQILIGKLNALRDQIALKIQEFSAAVKAQVASGDASRPDETVQTLHRQMRKLQADFQRQLRLLQRQVGISQAEIRNIERAGMERLLPDGADILWRDEIENAPSNRDMDPMAERAIAQFADIVNPDWLLAEAKKPYRLQRSFLTNPLHLVSGVRVDAGAETEGPQRFARMLLLTKDHLEGRIDLDFFSGATLVPELCVLGDSIDEIESLGPEAQRKLAGLSSMTDDEVSSTVYELLVGSACVRSGLDLTMIPEDRSKKVPEYRINSLYAVPAVIECKRRRRLTEYELKEATCVEEFYNAARSDLREHGVYGSFEACFAVPLQGISCENFVKHLKRVAAKPDQPGTGAYAMGILNVSVSPLPPLCHQDSDLFP